MVDIRRIVGRSSHGIRILDAICDFSPKSLILTFVQISRQGMEWVKRSSQWYCRSSLAFFFSFANALISFYVPSNFERHEEICTQKPSFVHAVEPSLCFCNTSLIMVSILFQTPQIRKRWTDFHTENVVLARYRFLFPSVLLQHESAKYGFLFFFKPLKLERDEQIIWKFHKETVVLACYRSFRKECLSFLCQTPQIRKRWTCFHTDSHFPLLLLQQKMERDRQKQSVKKLMHTEERRVSTDQRGEFDDLISALRTGDVFGDEMSKIKGRRRASGQAPKTAKKPDNRLSQRERPSPPIPTKFWYSTRRPLTGEKRILGKETKASASRCWLCDVSTTWGDASVTSTEMASTGPERKVGCFGMEWYGLCDHFHTTKQSTVKRKAVN